MNIDSPNSSGISTGFGIPTGGTANQVLTKINSTNYNTQWVDNTISGTTPVYLCVRKTSNQLISNNTNTVITDWGYEYINNTPSAWNSTTGTWTCPVEGVYSISVQVQLSNNTPSATGTQFTVSVGSTIGILNTGYYYATSTASVPTPVVEAKLVIPLSVGTPIYAQVYQNLGSTINIVPPLSVLTITQLPNSIT
jgi:hypothetical protein